MIKCICNLSIKRKLLLAVLFPGIVVLAIAGLVIIALEITELQENTQRNLTALATVIATHSADALLIMDKDTAYKNLAALKVRTDILGACIYAEKGDIVAEFVNAQHANWRCPTITKNSSTHFEGIHLHLVHPIVRNAKTIGTVYIHADYSEAYWRKIYFAGLLFLLLLSVSILIFLITTVLLKIMSTPIKKLIRTIKTINGARDYSMQISCDHDDELGVLVDAFNELLRGMETQNQTLIRAKDHYRMLYDDNPTMVFNLTETGKILSVNRTGARQLGLTIEELQKSSIFDFIHPNDLLSLYTLFEYCLMSPLLVHKGEIRQICQNGRIVWIKVTVGLVENEHSQTSLLLVCEDISEAHDLSEKIAYQASHDSLTGLVNRHEFDKYISNALNLVQSNKNEHALCYLDLDQFKVINDTHGHIAGDELLRQLGGLLKANIRQHDIVARLGGDEFGILMYNCSLAQAFKASEKIRDVIKEFRFLWESKSFSVAVSIGISVINADSSGVVHILNEADAACCAAKEKGRNRVHVFRPDDEELAIRRGEMQWVGKIRTGLEENRFCLYGQTIVPLSKNHEGLHFETLIRYRDDQGMIVPPGAFLPAAERYNLAIELDRWVISTLFAWMGNHPYFLKHLSLCSINLSGLSLSDETLLVFIAKQFAKWGIPQEKICFEITETAAIANLSYATKFIHTLREYGCSFSLDDFGSGLSSFAYLKNLPVDYLKIDGLFVKSILENKVDLAMIKAINEVGHVMNKKTIAEFVENEKVFNLLSSLGVDYAQGYGISKPVPLGELKLVKSDSPVFK